MSSGPIKITRLGYFTSIGSLIWRRRRLLALATAAFLVVSQSNCAVPGAKQPAPSEVEHQAISPVPHVSSKRLAEENLGGVPNADGTSPISTSTSAPTSASAPGATAPGDVASTSGESPDTQGESDVPLPQPVPPPDLQKLVASIGPDTSPQLAASLRLTDEGRRLLQDGNTAAALDRIEKAVKIDPSDPHAYYWLAQVHFQSGRLDQALAFCDKSIALFGPQEPMWLAQAYTFRASILERAGRFRDARESYQRAVQVEPGDVAAQAGLARLSGSTASP